MPHENTYSIGNGVIEAYEAEVLADLEELYPDEAEREIVLTILIPHFREQLRGVFDQFREDKSLKELEPVHPSDVDELCKAVDTMLMENRALLDLDGLFKSLMDKIQSVREEIGKELTQVFHGFCRDLLASHGVAGRRQLFDLGVNGFRDRNYPPYGKGSAFAGKILGRRVGQPYSSDLEEIADILGLPEVSEAYLEKCRDALRSAGIVDRRSFFLVSVTDFRAMSFPPFGKGAALSKAVLGRAVGLPKLAEMTEIADVLSLPEIAEEALEAFRVALKAHGITDKGDLSKLSLGDFDRLHFEGYGNAREFVGLVRGSRARRMSSADLGEMAVILKLPELSEENKGKYRDALREHGILDRLTLLNNVPIAQFTKLQFGEYGTARRFVGRILNRTINHVSLADLEELAGLLELEYRAQENTKAVLAALKAKGVSKWSELMGMGPGRFGKESNFEGFGSGFVLARQVLGKPIHHLNVAILEELAAVFGWEEGSEEDKKREYIEILAARGIRNRDDLMALGSHDFIAMDFSFLGQGNGFASQVLGRSVAVTSLILEEVADALGWRKDSPEQLRAKYLAALAVHGLTDYHSLMRIGPRKFAKLPFEGIGKGTAFMRLVTGDVDRPLSIRNLEALSAAVGFEKPTREDLLEQYKEALAAHGAFDRESLIKGIGSMKFPKLRFGKLGTGRSFAGKVLGRQIRAITIPVLEEIAGVLYGRKY